MTGVLSSRTELLVHIVSRLVLSLAQTPATQYAKEYVQVLSCRSRWVWLASLELSPHPVNTSRFKSPAVYTVLWAP